MKKFLMILFAGAVLVALGAGCEKDNPQPKWKPLPPLELDDELYFYLENGQKEYFIRRKDRVIIKTGSYEEARVMSMEEVLQVDRGTAYYIGEWVFGAINSTQTDLSDVLALPGALDATYGLEYKDGTMQYTTNQISIKLKPTFTPQGVLEKIGLSEYVASIELASEYNKSYLITLDLRVEEALRICRALYETKQCVYAEPNFFRELQSH